MSCLLNDLGFASSPHNDGESCGYWVIQSPGMWGREKIPRKWLRSWAALWGWWEISGTKNANSDARRGASWSTSVYSLRALRSLCLLGAVSSIWLVASHLAWSSVTHTRHFSGASSMPWPRFRLGTGQQEVEGWLEAKMKEVEVGMKLGQLSARKRLFITCSI